MPNALLSPFTTLEVQVKSAQSCPALYNPMDCRWNSPGQNILVAFPFSNPGIEPRSPSLQADSLPAEPSGKPCNSNNSYKFLFHHLHFTDEEMGSYEEKEITQTTVKRQRWHLSPSLSDSKALLLTSTLNYVCSIYIYFVSLHMATAGCPGGSVSKESTWNADLAFHPWVGKIPWRKKWQTISVFLPGKYHGQRRLAGSSPWGCRSRTLLRLNHCSRRIVAFFQMLVVPGCILRLTYMLSSV